MEMLKNLQEAYSLSERYEIPAEDIVLVALNCSGVNSDIDLKRIRFHLKLDSCSEEFYIALPVVQDKSNFILSKADSKLLFNGIPIGSVREIENDTCDSTYFRRNKTSLTLNSNSRSACRGCKFCGTYVQDADDLNNLTNKERLNAKIDQVMEENNMRDLNSMVEVAICTGCFPNEEATLNHLLMVRESLYERGFSGELKYIGSQITSEDSLDFIKEAFPFAYYFTVECFTRRKKLMKPLKSKVTLAQSRQILNSAKRRGFQTSILYIMGLDPSHIIGKELHEYLPHLTRFPVINLFQAYKPEDNALRYIDAFGMEYYLKLRKRIEGIYESSNFRPRPWENYRPLWYLKFGKEDLHGIRI